MKVVLDMDPGVDDAVALILALNNPDLEVLAVTTVAGNLPVSQTTLNALKVIETMRMAVPVYRGAGAPLLSKGNVVTAENIHGNDGLGNSYLPAPKVQERNTTALSALCELLETHRRKEISVVATAPLTNIAMLKYEWPDSFAAIGKLSIMGGVFGPQAKGNVTDFAEFNFYCDPDAAAIVMEVSGDNNDTPEICVAGLDVTNESACAVTDGLLSRICAIPGIASRLACIILKDPVRTQRSFNLHDVFALFAVLHPDLFEFVQCQNVTVDTDEERRARCTATIGPGPIFALHRVQVQGFISHLLHDLGQT